jgi:hypothetical protein
MYRRGSVVAFAVVLAQVPTGECGPPPDPPEKSAREAVATFVKAYNSRSVNVVLKVTGVPFFAGLECLPSSNTPQPHARMWNSEEDFRKGLEGHFANKLELDSAIVRVERYADYRKKKLAEVPKGLNDFVKWGFLVRRQAMDEVIGKDGYIVCVGPKEKAAKEKRGEITEGILVRMATGQAKVVGFSNPALAWLNGWER